MGNRRDAEEILMHEIASSLLPSRLGNGSLEYVVGSDIFCSPFTLLCAEKWPTIPAYFIGVETQLDRQ